MQPDILMGRLSLNDFDSDTRRRAIETVKRIVDIAASRNLGTVAVCSRPDLGLERRDEAKRLLIDSLNDVCSYATQRGVMIIILFGRYRYLLSNRSGILYLLLE